MWIDVNERLPDVSERVLVKVEKFGINGETKIIVAEILYNEYWYAGFPFDQPVNPTHWCYSLTINE
jgi:hypothetical protein